MKSNIKNLAKKNEHIVKSMISDFNYNVINQKEIIELLYSVRKVYGFTNYRLVDFIEYIEDICNVEEVSSVNERMSVIPLYAKPKADIYDLAAASSRSSYFSFYTAITIHGLTLQLPKHIYMTNERNSYIKYDNTLKQEAIDTAFNKKPRQTTNIRTIQNYKLHLINGQSNNRLGVVPFRNCYFVTDVERTILDSVARPFYSGGVTQVLEAIINAKNVIDVDKLVYYYNQMHYIYPYHQALGFYLEKAGYEKQALVPFLKMKQVHKFYLTYNMRFTEFDPRWNLFFPRGF